MEQKTDCQVCKKLIKEKHRREIWWKIACIIFAALTIVLSILYFSSGKLVQEKEIEIERSFNRNTVQGEVGDINIASTINKDSYNGTVTEVNYVPIICISIVVGSAILVIGGVLIAHYFVRKSHD